MLIDLKALARTVVYKAFSNDAVRVAKMGDFRWARSARAEEIAAVERVPEFRGFSPTDCLYFNFKGQHGDIYNRAVIEELVLRYEDAQEEARVCPEDRSRPYMCDKFNGIFGEARTFWKGAQPRPKEDGILEDVEELAERLAREEEEHLVRAAADTRRRDVSLFV